MMTVNGVTTTTALGQEQYEAFTRKTGRIEIQYYQYDYRHTNGQLFSCIRRTLKACIFARDEWIKKQEKETSKQP